MAKLLQCSHPKRQREHISPAAAWPSRRRCDARERDVAATFISWIVLLRTPLDVGTVDEALEDLELVLAETESTDDPFGELVVSHEGRRHAPDRTTDHAQALALRVLEAWLS